MVQPQLPSLRTGNSNEKSSYTNVSIEEAAHAGGDAMDSYHGSGAGNASRGLQRWTSTALLISYFIFSVAFYTVLSDYTCKVFWFLYLTIAFLVAGVTALEAYDGLTPLREARKAIQKADADGWKFKTAEDQLPSVHLIFDCGDIELPDDLGTFSKLATGLMYPEDKIVISVLQSAEYTSTGAPIDYIGTGKPSSVRVLTVPLNATASLASRVAYCLAVDSYSTSSTITAIFNGDERPHPHALRHAAEKLTQDAKVDVLQGRSIALPAGILSFGSSLEYDVANALVKPGRTVTWGLRIPDNTNTYWRTEALRAVGIYAGMATKDGYDLPYAAVKRGTKSAYDLKLISYVPCPASFADYWSQQADIARQLARATIRYTGLVFTWQRGKDKSEGAQWSIKTRLAVLYSLPVLRLASQAVLQYFCLAFATLITQTPGSTEEFARTIYYPYPISQWFIIMGLVCLVAVVGMAYKARSEFIPGWTAPIALILYPFALLLNAAVDVYGQLDALVR